MNILKLSIFLTFLSLYLFSFSALATSSLVEKKVTSLVEGAPEISIHTKNMYDLYLNHLKGDEIVLIASNSRSGDGGVVQYEWLSGKKVVGRKSEIGIPSNRVGEFHYSLRITNGKKLSTTKNFIVTISPNVFPEIDIDQSNLFVPSKVILSIANVQKLVGIKSVKWRNLLTSDNSTGNTFTQIIQHVGQTPIEFELEDSFGKIFTERVIISAYSEGPYLEGPSEIEITPGDSTSIDYKRIGSSDTIVTLREQIPGIKVTEYGSLYIDVAGVPKNGKFITLVASNEFSSFEKKIKLVGLVPVPLATVPSGFVGTFIIDAPHSLLHKTKVLVTKEMTRGPTIIHFFEAKAKNGNLLITRTEGGELIQPLQITFPPSVMGAHLE